MRIVQVMYNISTISVIVLATLFLLPVTFLLLVQTKNFFSGQPTSARLKAKALNNSDGAKPIIGKQYAQQGLVNMVESQHIFINGRESQEFTDITQQISDSRDNKSEAGSIASGSPSSFNSVKDKSMKRGSSNLSNISNLSVSKKEYLEDNKGAWSNCLKFCCAKREDQETMLSKTMELDLSQFRNTPPI